MSSKKSKTSAECSASLQCTAQPPADMSDATVKLSDSAEDHQVAGSCVGHAALPKENRSPNLTLLDHLEAELDTYTDLDQVLDAALMHSSYSKERASCVQYDKCPFPLIPAHTSAGNKWSGDISCSHNLL